MTLLPCGRAKPSLASHYPAKPRPARPDLAKPGPAPPDRAMERFQMLTRLQERHHELR
jgi:hypothetical protein